MAHGLLDHAVFKRVKGNNGQTPANRQIGQNLVQKALQFAKLVIDGHAQSLKRARGRMTAGLGPPGCGIGPFHKGCQLCCGVYGVFLPGVHNGAGDAPRLRLFAKGGDAVLEPVEAFAIYPMPGRRLPRTLIHTHIQRPIAIKTESAPGFVQLKRRNADVQQGSVHLAPAQFAKSVGKVAVPAVEQMRTRAKGGQAMPCKIQGVFIAVKAAQFYVRS